MMKKAGIVLIIFSTLVLTVFAREMTVSAKSGLKVRDSASQQGKVLATLKNGSTVEWLEETGETMTLAGAKGKWTKIKSGETIGWAFGGFLADAKAEARVDKKPEKLGIPKNAIIDSSMTPELLAVTDKFFRAVQNKSEEQILELLAEKIYMPDELFSKKEFRKYFVEPFPTIPRTDLDHIRDWVHTTKSMLFSDENMQKIGRAPCFRSLFSFLKGNDSMKISHNDGGEFNEYVKILISLDENNEAEFKFSISRIALRIYSFAGAQSCNYKDKDGIWTSVSF